MKFQIPKLNFKFAKSNNSKNTNGDNSKKNELKKSIASDQ